MSKVKNKSATDALKGYEEAISYGKETVDAVMKSNAIFVKGIQDINTAMFDLAKATLEDNVAATQTIFDCKTFADVIKVQAALAQSSFAKAIEDSGKLSDLSVKVAEAASKPIAKQVRMAYLIGELP